MNNKGFTMAEILVVIAIIGLILAIAVPSVLEVRKKANTRLYNERKDMVLLSAKLYAADNELNYNIDNETIVTINDLIIAKYVESDTEYNTSNCTNANYINGCLTNPENNEILNGIEITIRKVNNSYETSWE